VTVAVVLPDGRRHIVGVTDPVGALTVEKSDLDNASFVLFCAESSFCGAVTDTRPLLDLDRFYIEIAPVSHM
jgi:hypothetical protein